MDARTILFLQGPPSRFWRELADAFEARGYRVLKVNFCLGDLLFWGNGAITYRQEFGRWPNYLADLIRNNNITDVVYYADRQPYHAVAREVCLAEGVASYVVENGYLRPDWLTLERGGMTAYSHFPADMPTLQAAAPKITTVIQHVRYPVSFTEEMFHEILFHMLTYLGRPLYPRYRSGRYYNPFCDYLSGAWRQIRRPWTRRRASETVGRLTGNKSEYFLVPLQLQSDYQICDNSPFAHLREMIDLTVKSFAKHAPTGMLVFKIHPHDNGYENWSKVVGLAAASAGVAERVMTIDGGDLRKLIAASRGLVVVNSTTGLLALQQGRLVKTLGAAIYSMPGLTFQGPLDEFWSTTERVDANLADIFVRVLAAATQVNGSFFNPKGRLAAIASIVDRIDRKAVNEPGAFLPLPPRLGDTEMMPRRRSEAGGAV